MMATVALIVLLLVAFAAIVFGTLFFLLELAIGEEEPQPVDTGFWADGIHYDAQGYDQSGVHYYTRHSASRGRRYS